MSRSTPGTPVTRQDRRRQELEQRREERRRAREAPGSSPMRSPIVLFTASALVVGGIFVLFMLLTRPGPPSIADLTPPTEEVPALLADGRTLGKADAKVTIEIWSDFQCPACRDLANRLEPLAVSTYVVPGTAKFVYRDAAFQGAKANRPYDESVEPAAAARCAADQGLFWQMHNWLFANWNGENRGAFAADRLRAIAYAAGLELGAYDTCMASGDKQAAARAETQSALAVGINSTPTLVINGVNMVGVPQNFTAFAQVIEQAAAAAP
jgi:protein-disulfide isomerase